MSEKARQLRGDLVVEKGNEPIAGQLHAMKQRMEALYSRNFDGGAEALEGHLETAKREELYRPAVDVWETGSGWLILMDLPGVGEEDFHLEIVEGQLVIQGSRRPVPVPGGTAAAPLERPSGAFSRTLILPADTQAEAIKAELKHGVLAVSIAVQRCPPAPSQKVRVRLG